jgi:hypothetical protein
MCERVFLTVDTPAGIVGRFGELLYAVTFACMSRLLYDLRCAPEVKSCYAFGDVHHVALRLDADMSVLESRLKEKGYADIDIRAIAPTVEDCFMRLTVEDTIYDVRERRDRIDESACCTDVRDMPQTVSFPAHKAGDRYTAIYVARIL